MIGDPQGGESARTMVPGALLQVRQLRTHFPVREGLFQRVTGVVRALDGVDLAIQPGETLGLVGESGSGKTTLGKAIVGLVPATAGGIRWTGEEVPLPLSRRSAALRRAMQMVFQDISNSLNPRRTVGATIADPLVVNRVGTREERRARVQQLLEMVELPTDYAYRYPHEVSGGERQRVGVARALALDPKLIVLDEPTSSLDVSVQAKVVGLLAELQKRLGLTYLLISHDMALVRNLATRVAVMYLGRLMEVADTAALFEDPRHPYTCCLLAAIPTVEALAEGPDRPRIRVLPGDVPSPRNPPPGCVFHTRCPMGQPVCAREEPPLRAVAEGHHSRCHFDTQTAS